MCCHKTLSNDLQPCWVLTPDLGIGFKLGPSFLRLCSLFSRKDSAAPVMGLTVHRDHCEGVGSICEWVDLEQYNQGTEGCGKRRLWETWP